MDINALPTDKGRRLQRTLWVWRLFASSLTDRFAVFTPTRCQYSCLFSQPNVATAHREYSGIWKSPADRSRSGNNDELSSWSSVSVTSMQRLEHYRKSNPDSNRNPNTSSLFPDILLLLETFSVSSHSPMHTDFSCCNTFDNEKVKILTNGEIVEQVQQFWRRFDEICVQTPNSTRHGTGAFDHAINVWHTVRAASLRFLFLARFSAEVCICI